MAAESQACYVLPFWVSKCREGIPEEGRVTGKGQGGCPKAISCG